MDYRLVAGVDFAKEENGHAIMQPLIKTTVYLNDDFGIKAGFSEGFSWERGNISGLPNHYGFRCDLGFFARLYQNWNVGLEWSNRWLIPGATQSVIDNPIPGYNFDGNVNILSFFYELR